MNKLPFDRGQKGTHLVEKLDQISGLLLFLQLTTIFSYSQGLDFFLVWNKVYIAFLLFGSSRILLLNATILHVHFQDILRILVVDSNSNAKVFLCKKMKTIQKSLKRVPFFVDPVFLGNGSGSEISLNWSRNISPFQLEQSLMTWSLFLAKFSKGAKKHWPATSSSVLLVVWPPYSWFLAAAVSTITGL